jgi:multiple sugar transport system permease protein
MLRQLGLLNTFAALVIPAAAHGYSIFLLKGFFDSLPRELYESASMDGAGELRTFFQITLPMSAPILAVIALGAFTAAYGAFMFALLVCQDQSMWTLMVHIYQLQQDFGTPVIFAALVLAAIPTLLVFIFCQKIIMRGIVVPVEK